MAKLNIFILILILILPEGIRSESINFFIDEVGVTRPTYPPCPIMFNLKLNKRTYHSGDKFILNLSIIINEEKCLRIYILLNLDGSYFFFPDWISEIDYVNFCFKRCKLYDWAIIDLDLPEIKNEHYGYFQGILYDPENDSIKVITTKKEFEILP